MAGKEVVKEKVEASVITAIYKVNLHCRQCASEIKKPLLRTPGVHHVDFDLEKNEVKVKGEIDAVKIHKKIERLSKRKVELISPKVTVKAVDETKKVVVKETKEAPVRTIQLKVHMHCDQCERDLRTKLLRHKADELGLSVDTSAGIFNVKTDAKAQTLTVQGTIEDSKLLSYIQSRVNKRAQIIPPPKPPEKKIVVEEQKEKKIVVEEQKEKKVVVEEQKDKVKVETKTKTATTTTDIVEFKEEKKVEVKTKEGNPYFIHYVYAPQLFSDENPNACSTM